MDIIRAVLPEEYRASSSTQTPLGIAPKHGSLQRAVFVLTQDISVTGDVEVYVRLVIKRPGSQTPLGHIRFHRSRYKADEVLLFKLNSSTVFEGNDIFYVFKETSSGQLALPESVVQLECL